MKFIIGYKDRMSSVFRPDGRTVPVTLIKVQPCVVTAVKTVERDGYAAVRLGSDRQKRAALPAEGASENLGRGRVAREFRPKGGQVLPALGVGETVDLRQFAVGDAVDIVGLSKGRGFQGVVKRHGFKGSPKTHGHKDQLRMPGSIGATAPQRVFKGMRMAGRMGGARTTVKHLEVVAINPEAGEMAVGGAIPGARRSLVLIQSAASGMRRSGG